MATNTYLVAASALSVANVALLLVLGGIWLRNYRTFRTPLVLGLVAFAAVLLAENLVALYFFLGMGSLYAMDPTVYAVVLVLRGLQFVAVAILAYVTWQ